jgi:hypothetical protein
MPYRVEFERFAVAVEGSRGGETGLVGPTQICGFTRILSNSTIEVKGMVIGGNGLRYSHGNGNN